MSQHDLPATRWAYACMLSIEKALGRPFSGEEAAKVQGALLNPPWQPIESAPKDGTSIMLCWARDADGNPIDWRDDPKTAQVFVQVASWWGGEDGWVVYCDQISEPRLHFNPTHWLPLPPPPQEQA